MTKTFTQIKAEAAEYGEDVAEGVETYAYFSAKADWDTATAALNAIDKWSDKTYHDAAFQLIASAKDNALSGDYEPIELSIQGERTGVAIEPKEGNAAFYLAAFGTLKSMIEDMASEDYKFYEVIHAAVD